MDNKYTLTGIIAAFWAFLSPIQGSLYALFYVMVANCLCGLAADIFVNKKRFCFKKAWKFIWQSMVIALLVSSVFVVDNLNGDEKGAAQLVSYFVNAAMILYGLNILRNLALLMPDNPFVRYLAHFLDIQAAKLPTIKPKSDDKKSSN